jgi:hypothetical protein
MASYLKAPSSHKESGRSSTGGRALRLGGGPQAPRIGADDFGLIGFATVDADLEDLPLDMRGVLRCR